MKSFLAALVTTAAFAVAAWAAEPTALDQAVTAYEAGEYGKAVELASKVATGDPMHARAQYVVGECELAQDHAEAAEQAFRSVLVEKPQSVPGLVGLGRALTARGAAADAEKPLREAVKLDKKDVGAQAALGEALAMQTDEKKQDEGRKVLEAACKLDPKAPAAARSLVALLLKKGDAKAALAVADRLAQANPSHPMGHFLRGLALDRAGEDDDAITAYETAIAKDERFLDAHKNLAILCTAKNPLYEDAERTAKAFAHYAKYFEYGGKDEELRKIYETLKGFFESQR